MVLSVTVVKWKIKDRFYAFTVLLFHTEGVLTNLYLIFLLNSNIKVDVMYLQYCFLTPNQSDGTAYFLWSVPKFYSPMFSVLT